MNEVQSEAQKPIAHCGGWRRTERRTRSAKEIEQEIRRRERQRAKRFAAERPSYR